MTEHAYASEDLLQKLLEDYPNLLAGDQMSTAEPRRWLLVSREMAVPGDEGGGGRWSLDHLFLDQDAVPTLVEVKRSTDTRIRREVVGQMLDYAANAVVYWPVERLRSAFDTSCRTAARDPNEVMAEFLGSEADPDAFWQRAKTNLQAGKIRLVFVADSIPPELRRIVEFLNGQMDPAEVLAVEIRQYVGAGLKTLVPRVIGQTAIATGKKEGTPRETTQWDVSRFRKDLLERKGEGALAIADRIMAWAEREMPLTYWGKGTLDGSYIPEIVHNGKRCFFFALWTNGALELQTKYMRSVPGFEEDERRMEFIRRINEIPGVTVPTDAIARRPSFQMSVLSSDESVSRFLAVMEWAIAEVRARAT